MGATTIVMYRMPRRDTMPAAPTMKADARKPIPMNIFWRSSGFGPPANAIIPSMIRPSMN